MAEIVGRQRWVLPSFTDIDRYPAAVGEKFRPAMISFNCAFVLVRRNGGANGKARGDTDAPCERNEVSMKVRTISGACIAREDDIASAPAAARCVVTHPAKDVVVERLRPV